jgi:hypothetical protein
MGLVDGSRLEVRHPEFVALGKRNLLHINPETDYITWIEPVLVLKVSFKEGAPTPQPPGKPVDPPEEGT